MFGREESEPARRSAAEFKAAGVQRILELGGGQGRDSLFSRARAQAAEAQLLVLEGEVVPRAGRTLEAMRASYASGDAALVALLDAESALLDASLSAVRQRAALADAAADLRRAAPRWTAVDPAHYFEASCSR